MANKKLIYYVYIKYIKYIKYIQLNIKVYHADRYYRIN